MSSMDWETYKIHTLACELLKVNTSFYACICIQIITCYNTATSVVIFQQFESHNHTVSIICYWICLMQAFNFAT